jgi:hypothetical protein
VSINPDDAFIEDFMAELQENCDSCNKWFWADTHNDREEGWFCDECLEHPEDKLMESKHD